MSAPSVCVGCKWAEWQGSDLLGRCTHPSLAEPLTGRPVAAHIAPAIIWRRADWTRATSCPTREAE